MFDFMKPRPKPKPPVRVHDCVENIDAWRRYVLAEMEATYERISKNLTATDTEILSRLPEIITDFEQIEERVSSSLNLMQQEIQALKTLLNNPETIGYTVQPVLHPASGNLEFKVVVIDG